MDRHLTNSVLARRSAINIRGDPRQRSREGCMWPPSSPPIGRDWSGTGLSPELRNQRWPRMRPLRIKLRRGGQGLPLLLLKGHSRKGQPSIKQTADGIPPLTMKRKSKTSLPWMSFGRASSASRRMTFKLSKVPAPNVPELLRALRDELLPLSGCTEGYFVSATTCFLSY
jgi:hypothetical protein